MVIKKRKYFKEQKEEIVQRALSSEGVLKLGKENNISPGLINRWKRQYLDGELINNNTDQSLKAIINSIGNARENSIVISIK